MGNGELNFFFLLIKLDNAIICTLSRSWNFQLANLTAQRGTQTGFLAEVGRVGGTTLLPAMDSSTP